MKRQRIEAWVTVPAAKSSPASLAWEVVSLVEPSPTAREEADALRAALAWWRAQRPLGRTEDEHIRNPAVNTTTVREKALAKSMARLQAARKRAKP